jgi:hypothetical protein
MPSETWPLERIAQVSLVSFLVFGLIRIVLQKVIVPIVWPKFNDLDERVQKDFCVRCTSVVVRTTPAPSSHALARLLRSRRAACCSRVSTRAVATLPSI